uniref:Uncharacterized protein n=1 Tax=Magallana gigas TaxID=29159 RepID=K1PYT7_MAGGI
MVLATMAYYQQKYIDQILSRNRLNITTLRDIVSDLTFSVKHVKTHIEHDLKMTNNSTLIECCSSADLNLVGKVTTGIVTCMAIFLNGFVFFVALFSKRLKKVATI